MTNLAVTTKVELFGSYTLPIGTVLEVVDKSFIHNSAVEFHEWQYRGDEHIWVRSPDIEDGEPFTIALHRLKIFNDMTEYYLWELLYL